MKFNLSLLYFIILCGLMFFLAEYTKYLLNINNLIYADFSEKFTGNVLESVFQQTRNWQLIGYILLPILLFVKTQIIAGILGIGAFLFNKKISHGRLWNIVLKAEFLFLLVGVLKIIWFYFFRTNYTLEDIEYFYPLSMLNIVGYKNVEPWYIYPLQTLNVFEMFYWIILALLIDKELEIKDNIGIKIVASSYGPALFLWVVGVMFFTLNIS